MKTETDILVGEARVEFYYDRINAIAVEAGGIGEMRELFPALFAVGVCVLRALPPEEMAAYIVGMCAILEKDLAGLAVQRVTVQ